RLPPFAAKPVLALAALVGVALLMTSGSFGYMSDELYFIGAGKHLDWGYADQPPLLPLLAHLMDVLFPGSQVGLRLPATLPAPLGIAVTALIARELGGRRRAQVMAAVCFAISPFLYSNGHHLMTSTIDPVLWTVATWLLVRWVRTRDDRLWLVIGGVTAIALEGKYLIVLFWVVAAAAALMFGPREAFRRPLVGAGAAIAVLGTLPSVIWQVVHGWPQLGMGSVIADEQSTTGAGQFLFLPVV